MRRDTGIYRIFNRILLCIMLIGILIAAMIAVIWQGLIDGFKKNPSYAS